MSSPMPPMSNQVYAPARRSFFGPVFLIGLGVVFLLVNIGQLTMYSVFLWFARYWPLLLIVWGLVRLAEHAMAKREGRPAPGIGFAGGFLVVMIVLLGLSASGFMRAKDHINWGAVREEMDIDDSGMSAFFGTRVDHEDEQAQALPAGATLKIVNERGSVKVFAGEGNEVKVKRHMRIYAGNESEANKLRGEIALEFRHEGTEFIVSSQRNRGARVDLEIYAPAKGKLEVQALRGEIEVRNRQGDVVAHASRGGVTLDEITGNADVHLRGGSFIARKVSGDLALEGRVQDTTVQDVGGSASFSGDYFGDMELTRIAKAVRFKSSRTDLEFAKLEGEMRMADGDLRAANFAGPLRLVTRSKDIHFEDFTGDMRVENSNGEVELHPRSPLGNVQVENRRGRIQVFIPNASAFQMDATSRKGEIESDFELTKVGEAGSDVRATGTVGKGGAKVQLSNEGSSIEIRKS